MAVDIAVVHGRVAGLALAQSADIRASLIASGVTSSMASRCWPIRSPGWPRTQVVATVADGTVTECTADVVLIATGASPRILPDAEPDGERILTWRQVYSLTELPEHLIVIGSGVTGAEFASAYTEMGVKVTLVSSRDRVLPSEDADAAAVIEKVFSARGSVLAKQSRAKSVKREGDGVVVTLEDGREIRGLACADDGRRRAEHRRDGSGRGRCRRRPGRLHPGGQGVQDFGVRRSTRPATAPEC